MLEHEIFFGSMFGKTAEDKLIEWVNESNIEKSDIVSITYRDSGGLTIFYYSKN